MAFNNDISSAVAQYVYTQSDGNVTEPVNGSYLQAFCEYLGVTESVDDSWLVALCIHFGITEPLNGSWTIALANYYDITYPTGGTWWMALAFAGGGPIPVDLIWNTTDTDWNLEEEYWLTAIAPGLPTFDQEGDLLESTTPTLTGTCDVNNKILLTINNVTYTSIANEFGIWSVDVTQALPGAPLTGQNYSVYITAKDLINGLESSIIGSVNILQSSKTLTFEMRSSWSLYWFWTAVQVQQETTPGVWNPIEIDGNPFIWSNSDYTGTQSFYKTDNIGASMSGIYGIRYYAYDPSIPQGQSQEVGPAKREITLDSGYNYRIVAQPFGSTNPTTETNYGQFNWYTVKDGTTTLLPEYPAVANNDIYWYGGYIQQTFTL